MSIILSTDVPVLGGRVSDWRCFENYLNCGSIFANGQNENNVVFEKLSIGGERSCALGSEQLLEQL